MSMEMSTMKKMKKTGLLGHRSHRFQKEGKGEEKDMKST